MTLRVGVPAVVEADGGTDFVEEAERLGADSVWSAEAWGGDALTPLAYLAARTERVRLVTGIAQLGARTPAALAMTGVSMQRLSQGRFVLGLGTSGPQVVEGWHGVPFARPVRRTRETIEVLRLAWRGERVRYDGELVQLPLPGGAGRPLRGAFEPVDVPVLVAALGPANLRLTGELADGWIGTAFVPEHAEVYLGPLREGAAAAGRTLEGFEVAVAAGVEFGDDVDALAAKHARGYAFTFGAMGSADQNFYNEAFTRVGYGEAVREVQALWLAGRREEAAAAVPVDIGLRTNLLGPPDVVKERLRAYTEAGVTTIRAGLAGDTPEERLATLGQLMDLVHEVGAEDHGSGRAAGALR